MSIEAVHVYETPRTPTFMRTQPGLTRFNSLRMVPNPPASTHKVERYAKLAVRHATVEQIEGQWLATIEGFPGVWACEGSAIEALSVLEQVVVDWALLKIQDGDGDLPRLGDFDPNVV